MAKQEQQHVVPRLYLRGFADSKTMVSTWRRSGVQKTLPLARVAVRNDFYSFVSATGELDRSIERWFGQNLENLTAPVLSCLRGGGQPRPADSVALGRFVAGQLLRSPAVDELMQEVDGHLGAIIYAQSFFSKYGIDPSSLTPKELRRIQRVAAEVWQREGGTDRLSRLRTMFREMDRQAADFCSRTWTVLRSALPLLIASDAPVVTFNRTAAGGWQGLVPPGAAVMMPLSPRALLLGEVSANVLETSTLLGPDMAQAVNEKQAVEASDVLISAPGVAWPRGLKFGPARARLLTPTVTWSAGGSDAPTETEYPPVRDEAIDAMLRHLTGDTA